MQLKASNIKAVFTENRLLKLLALLLATISIYSIQRITNQLEEFEIPIVVKVEPGVAVLRQDARTAYITCRGSLDDLKRLNVERLRLVVNAPAAGVVGTEQIPIGPRNVTGTIRGVTITRVRPGIVNLTFDREIEKQINIARPELAGQPLLGRAEVEFEPKIVTVRGPRQQIDELKILRTGPIDVSEAVDSFTTELPILTGEDSGIWEVIPSKIEARVNIVTEAISKEWENIPVLALRGAHADDLVLTLEPNIVDFSVLGSPQSVNRIKNEDIRVFVDCSNIEQPGTFDIQAAVHIQLGRDVSSAITPPIIKVTAQRPAKPRPPAASMTNRVTVAPVTNSPLEESP